MQDKGVPEVNLTETITLSEDVVARELGEETMLLDLASGTYFGLNPVGGRFWQLLEEGCTAAEARDRLLQEFEVDTAVLDADLSTLLDELVAKGLIATA